MQRRSFHETIIAAIHRVPVYNLSLLADLILETKIPEGHDQIIVAWKKKIEGVMFNKGESVLDVVADLLEQKEEERKRETNSVILRNLDELSAK